MTTSEKPDWVAVLPWIFLILLPVGFGVLALGFWIADPDWRQFYSMISGVVVILSMSMIVHVWVFCRASGRGIGAVWQPALILNVVIILPSPAYFIVALYLGLIDIIPTWPLMYLCMAGIAGVLIFAGMWLMRSRIFASIFDKRFHPAQFAIVILDGGIVWLFSAFEIGAVITRMDL